MEEGNKSHEFLGIMLVIVAAIMQAIASVSVRTLKETPAPIILFYHCIIGTVLIWIYILIEYGITNEFRMSEYTFEMWLIVYAAAFLDSFSMLSTTVAYQNDSAGFTALITYVIIFYSFMCDLIFFQEQLTLIEFVAAMVILFTAFGVTFYKLM